MLDIPHPNIHKRETIMILDDCDKFILDEGVKYLEGYNGPNNTMLELGSHVGCSSLFFAIELEFKRILAVEAYWENFKWLVNNIYKNQTEDIITPMWAAVSNKTGNFRPIYWSAEQRNHGQYGTFFRADFHPQSGFVQTISFKHLLSLFDSIDILKVDIEGSEYEIFSPNDKKLAKILRKVHFLDLETHCLDEGKYFTDNTFAQYGYRDTAKANDILANYLDDCGFELDQYGVKIGRMQGYNRKYNG